MKKLFTLFISLFFALPSISAQTGSWTQLSSFIDGRERMFSFVVNDKLYVGTGRGVDGYDIINTANQQKNRADVWAYDFEMDTWEQKKDFPTGSRRNSSGFSINNVAYVVCGYKEGEYLNDFYKYDDQNDEWEQLPDFPGEARGHSNVVVLNNKAYLIGGGADPNYYNDIWEYDPDTQTWTQKPDFPGPARWRAAAYAIDDIIYCGLGNNYSKAEAYSDFWAYDTKKEEWTQKADYPSIHTTGTLHFTLDQKAYVLYGSQDLNTYGTDFYEYNPTEDKWTNLGYVSPNKAGRILGFAETYKGKAYTGCGRAYTNSGTAFFYDDFWVWDKMELSSGAVSYTNWENIADNLNFDDSWDAFALQVMDENTIWGLATHHSLFDKNFQHFFKTIDGGKTWINGQVKTSDVENIESWNAAIICPVNESIARMVLYNYENYHTLLLKTTDGGETWNEETGPFSNNENRDIITMHFYSEKNGIAIGNDYGKGGLAVYKTKDSGENWFEVETPPMNDDYAYLYSGNNRMEVLGDAIWIGTAGGRVMRSLDRGDTWEMFDVGIGLYEITSIAFKDSLNGIAVTDGWPNYTHQMALLTNDGGETWASINLPAYPVPFYIEHVPNTENTYVAYDAYLPSAKILYTTDGGYTWQLMDKQPSFTTIQFIDKDTGFIGGQSLYDNSGQIFKWTGGIFGDEQTGINEETRPDIYHTISDMRLSPNPAGASHNLKILNPDRQYIQTLELRDMKGRLITSQTLQSDQAIISLIPFNEKKLSEGVYLITLKDINGRIISYLKWVLM